MGKCYFRVRKYSIYSCFFLSAGWLNRFGSVQSVLDFRNRTEPNRNFFVIFLSVNSVRFFRLFFFQFSRFNQFIGFLLTPVFCI
jgi:hypothetical protein